MLSDGFHDVPAGKVAAVVTHLEMRTRPGIRPGTRPEMPPEGQTAPEAAKWPIRRVMAPSLDWYRDLFLRVGGQDWLWFSRMGRADAELSAILSDPMVHVHAVDCDGRAEGLLELDFRTEGACELAYFGLTSALIGQGMGRALMDVAIDEAWSAPITRFHVHTCTLDSPQALGFYIRSGFTPVRQQIEIADDPRLTGDLPMDAGPHVPVLRG